MTENATQEKQPVLLNVAESQWIIHCMNHTVKSVGLEVAGNCLHIVNILNKAFPPATKPIITEETKAQEASKPKSKKVGKK